MKRISLITWWLLSLFLPVLVQAGDGVPASAFTERAKRTKERIDYLFRHRNNEPARMGLLQNPFRLSTDVPLASSTATSGQSIEVEPELPTSEEALLRQAVATLDIKGKIEIGGQINVTINRESYKEGGIIIARVQGKSVNLRIRRITSNSVTFALNDPLSTAVIIQAIPP